MLELEITAAALARVLARDRPGDSPAAPLPVLLDVREPWEFDKARLPDSILMPMGDIPGRAHQELDPETHIVTICHHGVRSLHVAVWLRNQGFENVQSLTGGIDAWSAQVDPAVPRY
jgi:rhodanese-related sulfurtransferase